jgi:hypothetical protein
MLIIQYINNMSQNPQKRNKNSKEAAGNNIQQNVMCYVPGAVLKTYITGCYYSIYLYRQSITCMLSPYI